MGHPIYVQVATGIRTRKLMICLLALIGTLPACGALSRERLVYDERGIEVGIEHDPSTSKSSPAVLNSHPARLTADDVRILLGHLRVSGWTGMIGGVLRDPTPIPLLKDGELDLVAKPLATALAQAGPEERVFFSIPNLTVPYDTDRTAGSLFVRGPYLHVTLQDHSALLRTDTAGGEDYKDPRDLKGMHLWTARPVKAAALAPQDTPAWGPFERVHVSLNIQEALAARSPIVTPSVPLVPVPQPPAQEAAPAPPPQTQPAPKTGPAASSPAEAEDLRLLLRELTTTNQELRSRLKEQAQDVQALKDELAKLRQEMNNSKAKSKPHSKPSAP